MKTPTPEDFLPLLANNPAKAADLFANWAYATLAQAPPRILRSLDNETREDIINEIIIHCFENDCENLKKYDPELGAFGAWFYKVSYFKILSAFKARGIKPIGDDVEDHVLDSAGKTDKSLEYNDLAEKIWKYIGSLGEKCQRLIKLAAEEYKPKEMTTALGLSETENANVSNDLRYCRKKLKAALQSDGITYEDIFHDL